MGVRTGPNIDHNDLYFCFDSTDSRSYGGSGSTWYDVSGNQNNGTLNNVSFTNNSMVFNGSSSWVDVDASSAGVPKRITVEAVTKLTSMSGNKVIVAHGGNGESDKGFLLQYEASSYGLCFIIQDSPNPTGAATLGIANSAQYLNQFIHIVGVYDNNFVRLYINGSEVSTVEWIYGFERRSSLRIGNELNRSYYLQGEIPVVKIHSRALSDTEISKAYNSYKKAYYLS